MMRLAPIAGLAALLAGCLPLIAGPNNFIPAGETATRPHAFGLSAEFTQPMTTGMSMQQNSDVKAMWLSEDVNLRLGLGRALVFEGQLKWGSTIPFFVPLPIGLSAGLRTTVVDQQEDGFAMDFGGHLTGLSADQTIGSHDYTSAAYGADVLLPISYRLASWFAVTGSPFARFFFVSLTDAQPGGTKESQQYVMGTGISVSLEIKPGGFAIAPACSFEAVRATGEAYVFLISPGLSLAGRW